MGAGRVGLGYPESFDTPSEKPRGRVMTVEIELAGRPFTPARGPPDS